MAEEQSIAVSKSQLTPGGVALRKLSSRESPMKRESFMSPRMSRLENRTYSRLISRGDLHAEYDSAGRRQGPVVYENSYRMAPKPEEKFRSDIAKFIMNDVLKNHLEEKPYSQDLSISLAKTLADLIKEQMKFQAFSKRYKYVCVVTIGERSHIPKTDGITVSSRCLWNTETDNFACATFKSRHLYAVSTLYALYFE